MKLLGASVVLPLFLCAAGEKLWKNRGLHADARENVSRIQGEKGFELPVAAGDRSLELTRRGVAGVRMAVLITGLEDAFTWAHVTDRFISPTMKQGVLTDFYIRLVARDKSNGADWTPIKNEGSSPTDIQEWQKDATTLRGKISQFFFGAQTSGSQVKLLDLLDYKEDVDIPPGARPKIPQYSPVNTEVGRNLLRKFKSTEYLMHKVLEEERAGKFRYNFVMVSREDQTWMSPLNMRTFATTGGSENKVFSKNCMQWKGINDKVLVFGRLAAEKILMGLYSEFWKNQLDGYNAEMYLKAYIASKGVQSVLVDPIDLATSDTRWQDEVSCQDKQYHCNAAYEQKPVFCKYSWE